MSADVNHAPSESALAPPYVGYPHMLCLLRAAPRVLYVQSYATSTRVYLVRTLDSCALFCAG